MTNGQGQSNIRPGQAEDIMKVLVPKSLASANLAMSQENDSLGLTFPGSIIEGDSLQEKSQRNVATKSSRSARKPSKGAADAELSLHNIKGKIQKRSSKSASGSRSNKKATEQIQPKPKTKDYQMNKVVFMEGGLPDGAELTYICRGQKLLQGYKKGQKIYCLCCHDKVSPSAFEAHAGMASRKKPYANIYLSNGVSLNLVASSLNSYSDFVVKHNEGMCKVCGKEENLLLCSGCASSYHRVCVSETIIPPGKWFCKDCRETTKGSGQNDNVIACVICRRCDFSEEGFDDRTVIVCDQCEKEFHIGCLRKDKKVDLKALPTGSWFCSSDCGKIHSVIKKLLTFGPEEIPDSLMSLIRKKQKDNDVDNTNVNMKWVLLSCKNASDENRHLLSEAVDIFHDRFDPIIDVVTKSDFVPSMAYGLKMGNLDFGGMFCAMLTIDSKVVTAGLFRVLGHEVAELPLVATSKSNQGKGYFQVFFTCFEKLLSYLKVEKILLPAAEDAKPLWTNKMGFCEVTALQLTEYQRTWTSMVSFEETTLLEKEVPRGQLTYADDVQFSISME